MKSIAKLVFFSCLILAASTCNGNNGPSDEKPGVDNPGDPKADEQTAAGEEKKEPGEESDSIINLELWVGKDLRRLQSELEKTQEIQGDLMGRLNKLEADSAKQASQLQGITAAQEFQLKSREGQLVAALKTNSSGEPVLQWIKGENSGEIPLLPLLEQAIAADGSGTAAPAAADEETCRTEGSRTLIVPVSLESMKQLMGIILQNSSGPCISLEQATTMDNLTGLMIKSVGNGCEGLGFQVQDLLTEVQGVPLPLSQDGQTELAVLKKRLEVGQVFTSTIFRNGEAYKLNHKVVQLQGE